MYIACVSFHSLTDEQEVTPRDDANHVTAELTSRLHHLQASFVCSQLRILMKREMIDSSVDILHTETVLLEELYTLPKTHFMEQLTSSKHPIPSTNTILNTTAQLPSSHTFTEINTRARKHFTFSCFSSPGSASMCPNTTQKSWKL